MRGDKVDAGVWAPATVLIQIGAPGEPICHFADAAFVTFPKTPDGVAIFPVPFRPEHRKISNLVTAFAYIPWFRD